MDLVAGLNSRPMRVKILYTFDKSHSMTCLARTDYCLDIPVASMDDDPVCIGIVDLAKCLQTICRSSPEISTSSSSDFVVYSKDISENHDGGLYVGHGFLSALLASSRLTPSLSPDSGEQKRGASPVYIMGKVCNSLLPIFDSSETLEVHLRLSPVVLAAATVPQGPTPSHVQQQQQQQHELPPGATQSTEFVPQQPVKNTTIAPAPVPAASSSSSSAATGAPTPAPAHAPTPIPAPANPGNTRRSLTLAELEASVRLAKRQKSAPTSYYSHYLASSPPSQNDYSSSNPLSSTPARSLHAGGASKNSNAARAKPILRKPAQDEAASTSDISSSPSPSEQSLQQAKSTPGPTPDVSEPSIGGTQANAAAADKKKQKRPRDKFKIEKQLVAALAEGKIPSYCDNCGSIQTPTWRRFKTEDSEVLLCNPCGLWLATKKTMRPKEVWERKKGRGRKAGTPDINAYLRSVVENSDPIDGSQREQSLSLATESLNNNTETSRKKACPASTPADGDGDNMTESGKSSSARSSPDAPAPQSNNKVPGSNGPTALRPISLLHSVSVGNYSSPLHPSGDFDHINFDHLEETHNSHSSPTRRLSPSTVSMQMPMSESSSRLELPGHTLISHQHILRDLDANKENVPPAADLTKHQQNDQNDTHQSTNIGGGHDEDHFDIDVLFMTPKKRSLSASAEVTPSAHRTITPASKWISRFIQKTEDEEIFKAFMESPTSSRFSEHLSGALTSFDEDIITSESNNTVSSSPPPSFFYQYDEDPLPRKAKEQAQAASNMHTASNTPIP